MVSSKVKVTLTHEPLVVKNSPPVPFFKDENISLKVNYWLRNQLIDRKFSTRAPHTDLFQSFQLRLSLRRPHVIVFQVRKPWKKLISGPSFEVWSEIKQKKPSRPTSPNRGPRIQGTTKPMMHLLFQVKLNKITFIPKWVFSFFYAVRHPKINKTQHCGFQFIVSYVQEASISSL